MTLVKRFPLLAAASLLAACAGDRDGDRADGTPSPTPTPLVIGDAWRVSPVPDITGDGRGDLLAAVVDTPNPGVIVYAGPIGGALPEPFATFAVPTDVRIGSAFLGALDVLGDGAPDLVAGALFDGRVFAIEGPVAPGAHALTDGVVLQGDGSAFFGSSLATGGLGAGGARALAAASPGEPEEACFSATGLRVVALPLVGGSASLASTSGFAPFDCPGSWLASRDFTGDGNEDLLMASTDGGTWIFDGPLAGDLTPAGAEHLPVVSNVYGYWLAAAGAILDVDAGGSDELVLLDRAAGEIVVYTLPLGAAPTRIAVPGIPLDTQGDLDGDGFRDLVLVDDEFTAQTVWVMIAPLESSQEITGPFDWVSVGDVTDDGRDDLLTLGAAGLQIHGF